MGEKNLTSAQEEEMMMVLGKKGAMLEKKAKRLHEIFEDMEKSGKENKGDVIVMKAKFEEFKNMMEEVVGMGKARWSKVQAHREESDTRERKPEGKDTKERKPKGKGNDKKERKPEGKDKKQRRERKPLGKDKKQRREKKKKREG